LDMAFQTSPRISAAFLGVFVCKTPRNAALILGLDENKSPRDLDPWASNEVHVAAVKR
jgi:hypothetical protein